MSRRIRGAVRLLFVLILSLALALPAAQPAYASRVPVRKMINVLMIGNSLTYRINAHDNKTIPFLEEMARAEHIALHIEYVAYGSFTLEKYADEKSSAGKEVRAKIRSRAWDYVVLQQNTDRSVAKEKSTINAVKKLNEYIRWHCVSAKTVINSTWAYDKTKTLYKKKYTPQAQQQRINRTCQKAASAIGAKIVYSGNAFAAYKKTTGAKDLFLPDKNHPSVYGGYLNACCLYAVLFKKSPVGSSCYCGIDQTAAKALQMAAAKANGY